MAVYLLKRVWERLELAIIGLLITGFMTFWQHHTANQLKTELHSDTGYLGTNWVGHAMLDQHGEIYRNVDAITALSNRLSALEQGK